MSDQIYIVYAIQSEVDGRIYVGMTSNLSRRIDEHNSRKTRSTKAYVPWKLIFTEPIKGRENARIREKYWKSGTGKEQLKKHFKN